MVRNPFDGWHGFECGIIGPPELDNLCAEIQFGDEIVAWILDERDRRELRIENRFNGEPWLFDLGDFIAYVQHANHRLAEYDGSPLVVKALEVSSLPDAAERIAEIKQLRAGYVTEGASPCVVCIDLNRDVDN